MATARLIRAIGMRVHAINRRRADGEPVDWIGTPDRLHEMLTVSVVRVVAASLTKAIETTIGSRKLALMQTDAMLVSGARGEIIDETALQLHSTTHPDFALASTHHGSSRCATTGSRWADLCSTCRM